MQKAIEGAILSPLVISGFSLNTFYHPPYRIIKGDVSVQIVATHPPAFASFKTLISKFH